MQDSWKTRARRISEVVAVNVGDIKGSVLTLKSSKTDQEGKGEALYICESTTRVIKRYLRKSGIMRGASDTIKRWAAEAGMEGFISGHSFRVGFAVSLAQAGRRSLHADGRQMEISRYAGALRKSGTGGTGGDCWLQRWEAKESAR